MHTVNVWISFAIIDKINGDYNRVHFFLSFMRPARNVKFIADSFSPIFFSSLSPTGDNNSHNAQVYWYLLELSSRRERRELRKKNSIKRETVKESTYLYVLTRCCRAFSSLFFCFKQKNRA